MRRFPIACVLVLLAAPAAARGAGQEPGLHIRLNQLGFQTQGPKRAILRSGSTTPLAWRLVDGEGIARAAGRSRVFGENRGSGEHVHVIDFSSFREPGPAYRLIVGNVHSRPFPVADDIYSRLKYDALAYFYHNRSGIPIEARYVGDARWARPAGHAPDVATCFDGKDERGVSWSGCDYRLDATGGWYDAGDHGKYVVNAGISVWTLLNYYERSLTASDAARAAFADGRASIPESGNGVNDLLDEVRWELRFVLAMQAPQDARLRMPRARRSGEGNPLPQVELDVSGMAHHKLHDVRWTSLPMAPHEDGERRYLYPPSTTATLNLAANAAQCARIWRGIDPGFAERCLVAAERAFEAAVRHPDLLPANAFDGGGAYGDSDASDERYWAAAELFITTGREEYLGEMRASGHFLTAPGMDGRGAPSWREVGALGTISLALVPNGLPDAEIARARANLVAAADGYLAQARGEGYVIPRSATEYEWGSNAVLLNRALILALAYDFTGNAAYREAVADAMDYILGRNPLDQSYVTGYGARPVRNPHHRFWAHPLDKTYPPPPPGALSGGPNSSNMSDPVARAMKGTCRAQTCWKDDIRAFSLNEVAINWNAPLVWVAAFLDEPLQTGKDHTRD